MVPVLPKKACGGKKHLAGDTWGARCKNISRRTSNSVRARSGYNNPWQ